MRKEKPTHPDQKYIEALLNGDMKLIGEIYKKWGPEARRFVLKNNGTSEDAKDVFQETMVAILSKAREDKLILTVPFGGYLYFIYRANWINKLNKNGRNRVMIHELERYKDDSDVIIETFGESRFDLLQECFEKLSERCQHIIRAQYYEKLKGEEIEKKFKFPSIGAVRKAMYDCRENLKKCMMKHPDFNNSNLI